MSFVAPPARLGWRLLPAVVAAAAAVVAAGLLIGALRDRPAVWTIGGGTPARDATGVAAVEHARWETKALPVTAGEHPSNKNRARFAAQRPRVAEVVRAVVDSLVLPDAAPPGRRHVASSSLDALRGASVKIPKGAADVRAATRRVRIGVQVPALRAAVARARVRMTGTVDDRRVRWSEDITLWLDRPTKGWRVIAFDLHRARKR